MRARRWLLLGVVFITAMGVWWLLPRDADTSAPEATATPDGTLVPQSRAELPTTAMLLTTDAGTWNLEIVNAVGGVPVPHARVSVGRTLNSMGTFRVSTHPPPAFHGETDVQGHVLVVPPPSGANNAEPLRLGVTLPFFRPYKGEFVPGMRVVLEPLPPWHGRVISASGAPVSGARVLGADTDDAETVSEADGTFVLALPDEGRVFAVSGDAMAVASAVDGEPLELVLSAPPQRVGVVIGRDEQPLADVTVTGNIRAFSWVQTTGVEGHYRAPDLDGLEPQLRFEKPGYRTEEFEFREEVMLSRPSRLEGTLVDVRGRPIAGEDVEVGQNIDDYFMADDSVTTDDVGHFVFEDLTDPEVVLRAHPEDTEEDDGANLTVKLAEGETTRVTLAMPPHRDEVLVEYRSIADVEVNGCDTLATPQPPAGWNSSSSEGNGLMLTRGRFHFEVRCIDGRSADETREVNPRDETPLRFVVRQPDGGTPLRDELPPDVVRVRVVNAAGEPIEGATVRCDYRAEFTTNADGRAVCEVREDDSAWPLLVRAQKGELTGLTRSAGKEEAVVTLRERVVLRGRVDGPIPPGNWTAAIRSAAVTTNVPLTGSSFTFEGHTPARTFVCIESSGDGHASLGCAISEAGEDVVIHVGQSGKVSFTALDADGVLIEEPIVYFDRNQLYGITAVNGAVEFDAPPGDHVMILNVADSRARSEVRLTVKPGELTPLGPLKLE